ncbi:hypothetical protein RMI40_32085 [Pseudomonas protegens]|uniref:hypothetical protein n=1 Tax=Pseudomonas protegens TaxID=380021 RepID=UPI00287CD7DC|nr:hypothetical protein [Pseudomonas protegens]MDS9879473.1 hypothetical protein [Pseudomonas protegens]
MQQRYVLTIWDLLTIHEGGASGGESFVAIMDGQSEVDRMKFTGKTGPGGNGYRRSYTGKQGLTARLISGPGRIRFDAVTPAA